MQKQSIKNRKVNTSRTSNQGRKQSSGSILKKKKGNPDRSSQVEEKNPVRMKLPAEL